MIRPRATSDLYKHSKMVEVFKTNVRNYSQANKLVDLLLRHFPGSKINFDLKDCDKILRVAGINFNPEEIPGLIKAQGFSCSLLE